MKKIASSGSILIKTWVAFAGISSMLVSTLIGQQTFWTPKQPPVVSYSMTVNIDVAKDLISGSATISFINTGNSPLTHVALEWPRTERYSLIVSQGDDILEPINPLNTSQEPILIKLSREAGINQNVEIKVRFSRNGFVKGDSERIYLADKWYPRIWWDGVPVADRYSVALKYPDGYTVAATGKLSDTDKRYEVDRARFFAVYLGKNELSMTADAGGVKLTVVYPETGEKVANTSFSILQQAIPFFIKKYGFFPFSYLNVIPGDKMGPWGGYNFAPGIAVIHGMEHFTKKSVNFWKWISVHELCHHYWGECVFDNKTPSWLWIGLGIYADQSFLKHIGLDYQIYTGFQSQYFYAGVKKHFDTTLDISPDYFEALDDEFDWNNTVKHGKSYTVIKALEIVIGMEGMDQVMQKCMDNYRWAPLTIDDFQKIAEEVSMQNLTWFFDQWVKSSKYLSILVSDSSSIPTDKGYLTTIKFSNPGDVKMMVPVKVHFKDGSSQTMKTDRISSNPVLTFTSNSALDRIELDPDHQLPVFKDTVCPTPKQLDRIVSRLPYTDLGDDVFRPYELAKLVNSPISSTWFGLGIRFYDGGLLEQCKECFSKAAGLGDTGKDTSMIFKSNSWLGLVMDEFGNRNEAINFYRKALASKSEGSFIYSQFNLAVDKKYIEERLVKPYPGMKRVYQIK
jgi:hypothetical protein